MTSAFIRLLGLVVILGTACGVAGCSSPAANRMDVFPDQNASIIVNNSGLHSECEILAGKALYEGEILLGVAEVRSHEDEQQTLEYRWNWYDADGVSLADQGHWKSVFVKALEEQQITGRASEPGAVRGRFELRYHSGESADR